MTTWRGFQGRRGLRAGPFTMVELIVVLVIMAVLLRLAVPVFDKMVMGSNVDIGARLVASQLRLARQYAITKREYVAVMLPEKTFDSTDSIAGSKEYRASSIRTCICDSSGEFDRYINGTQWHFLPKGIYIDSYEDELFSTVTSVKFPNYDNSDTVAAIRAFIFKPTGSLTQINLGTLGVEEMILIGTSLEPKDGGANKVELKVNWLTGRVEEP